MTLRPGPTMLSLVAAWVGIALLAFAWPVLGWVVSASVLIATPAILFDYRRLRMMLNSVSVERELPVVVARGRTFSVKLRLKSSVGAALRGSIRDILPVEAEPNDDVHPVCLETNQRETEVDYALRIATRGKYELGPVWLLLAGPLRLLEGQKSIEDTLGKVKVLPESLVAEEHLPQDEADQMLLLDKLVHSRFRGAGTEFESLSEFRQGDDPRRIDWRVTARHGFPVVRRYQVERHRDVMLILDVGRLMGADAGQGTKLDCAVNSALMLARAALEAGDRCGLGVFSDRVTAYLPPLAGPDAMHTLTDCMYDLSIRWREADFSNMFATLQQKQAKRCLVVILSDIIDEESSLRIRTSLASLGRRHRVIFAALRTPALTEVIQSPIEDTLDGTRLAVTLRLLREREKALYAMRRGSVQVLDVEPSQLTIPLIRSYVEVRGKNLL